MKVAWTYRIGHEVIFVFCSVKQEEADLVFEARRRLALRTIGKQPWEGVTCKPETFTVYTWAKADSYLPVRLVFQGLLQF